MKQKLQHIIKLVSGLLGTIIVLLYPGAVLAAKKYGADSCALERFLPGDNDCWFCPLFRVIFNTSSTIALKAYSALANGVASLVIVGFALWVSVFVLKHVSAVEVKNPRKMIQEFIQQAFKVLIVVVILKVSYFQVMGLTLEPIFNTGMTFVQTVTGKGSYNSSRPDQQISCPKNAPYMQDIRGYDSKSGLSNRAAGGLPVSMGQNILCSIKSMQDSVSKMMAYGRQAWCVGWRPKAFIAHFIPSFPYIITGAVLYIGALILLVAFPWCLVDAVLQMTIACALAPAAIGTWPFKSVSNYLSVKKIWNFFMNAMFNFVFLSIIIYIIMTVVDQFMEGLNQRAASTDDWDFLLDPIDGLAYWGVTGMQLVVVCLMGWVFLDQGRHFANSFAKGASLGNMGRNVGGTFAQAANRVGRTAAKTANKVGKTVANAGMQVGDHFIGSAVRKARTNYRINKVKNNGTAITDEDGNITGYERTRRNLLGQKVTRRVDIGEDGKESWSKEKHSLGGELRTKARAAANNYRLNDLQENGEAILDENGNIAGYEKAHRNLLGQKVVVTATQNQDGTFSFEKKKHSLRMEALGKISKPGSAINQFAQKNAVFKQKALDKVDQTSKIIKSDHLMSVREHKDANGNIVGRDIAFKPSVVKHLVGQDGTINTEMLKNLEKGTTFDQKVLYEGIAQEVMKARGINIGNRFDGRQIDLDNNGILHLKQLNADGSLTELDMILGGPNNNQMLTELKTTFQDGSYTINLDNGIQHKTVNYRQGEENASVSYGFSEIYYQQHKHFKPLDMYGQFGMGINKEAAMFGFSDEDLSRHAGQVASGRGSSIPVRDEETEARANSNDERNRKFDDQ